MAISRSLNNEYLKKEAGPFERGTGRGQADEAADLGGELGRPST